MWKQGRRREEMTNEKRRRKGKDEIKKERIKISKINRNKAERKEIC
jgi:hypothetical protein